MFKCSNPIHQHLFIRMLSLNLLIRLHYYYLSRIERRSSYQHNRRVVPQISLIKVSVPKGSVVLLMISDRSIVMFLAITTSFRAYDTARFPSSENNLFLPSEPKGLRWQKNIILSLMSYGLDIYTSLKLLFIIHLFIIIFRRDYDELLYDFLLINCGFIEKVIIGVVYSARICLFIIISSRNYCELSS